MDSLKEVIDFLRNAPDVAFIKAAGKADCDLYPEEVRAVYHDVLDAILAEIDK